MKTPVSALMAMAISFSAATPALAQSCNDVPLVVRLDADGTLTVNDVVGDMDDLEEAAERKHRACRRRGAMSTFLRSASADRSTVGEIRGLLAREVRNLALIELEFREETDEQEDDETGAEETPAASKER